LGIQLFECTFFLIFIFLSAFDPLDFQPEMKKRSDVAFTFTEAHVCAQALDELLASHKPDFGVPPAGKGQKGKGGHKSLEPGADGWNASVELVGILPAIH
jgi:hypothetical protein